MQAEIESFDDEIEEIVVIRILNERLVCFATVCPYDLEIGRVYPVSLELFIDKKYVVSDAGIDGVAGFERIGDSLSYWICGKLVGGELNVRGIVFRDDVLRADYGYLDGYLVKVRADRLDLEFLDT